MKTLDADGEGGGELKHSLMHQKAKAMIVVCTFCK
jgi:hypothetical protein